MTTNSTVDSDTRGPSYSALRAPYDSHRGRIHPERPPSIGERHPMSSTNLDFDPNA